MYSFHSESGIGVPMFFPESNPIQRGCLTFEMNFTTLYIGSLRDKRDSFTRFRWQNMILKDTGTGTAYVASVFSVSHHAKFFLYLTFTCLTTSVKRTEKLILNVRRFYNPSKVTEVLRTTVLLAVRWSTNLSKDTSYWL